jgi:hypothetical protein
VHLVRRLGEIECRDCGRVGEPAAVPDGGHGLGQDARGPGGETRGPGGETPGLAEDVERALARVLGRAGRTAGIG